MTVNVSHRLQKNSLKKKKKKKDQNPLKAVNLRALFLAANFVYRKYALQYITHAILRQF